MKRRLGAVREPGASEGITRRQAGVELRRLIEHEGSAPMVDRRVDLATAAASHIDHVETVRGRKATTVSDYRSMARVHLVPFFGGRSLDGIDVRMVETYIAAKLREGLARRTVRHQVTLLHGIFAHAIRRGWCVANPVAAADLPPVAGSDPDIHFLDHEELEALIRSVPDDALGRIERVLYLMAAMTGLRQGELVALRWRDVDWVAGVVRVRRGYTRGEFTTPKSRRSSRAVPMADRLAAELERHHRATRWTADTDLVFAHPLTGAPYDASRMRKRFKEALARAGVRPIRFHDLRHTFGTRMAAAGAPLRAIQEWMGHRDHATTLIYADFAPDPSNGRVWAAQAFGAGDVPIVRDGAEFAGNASGSFAPMEGSSRATDE